MFWIFSMVHFVPIIKTLLSFLYFSFSLLMLSLSWPFLPMWLKFPLSQRLLLLFPVSSSRRRLAAPQVFLPAPHVPPPSRCSRSPGGEPPTFNLEQPEALSVSCSNTPGCYLRQSRKLHVADPFPAFITQQQLRSRLVHLTSVNPRLQPGTTWMDTTWAQMKLTTMYLKVSSCPLLFIPADPKQSKAGFSLSLLFIINLLLSWAVC